MLSISGCSVRLCDCVSRRSFLQIGALSFGAMHLSLADLFRAEACAGNTSRHKAVINIFLCGGPPHQDLWDIKTEAPAEIRGEFQPIATRVPGIQIGEVFPRIAGIMDRCVPIRSVVGADPNHMNTLCLTGWSPQSLASLAGRPSLGSAVTKLQGPVDPAAPPYVTMGMQRANLHKEFRDSHPGFLGHSYKAFAADGSGLQSMKLQNIRAEQFADRRRLLSSFDTLRRDLDANGAIRSTDTATEQALSVLTSSKLMEALDVSCEPEKIRARYGDGMPYKFVQDGAETDNRRLLIARRLVEAGARVVTVNYGRWDSHGRSSSNPGNSEMLLDHGPKLDQCFSALVEDLEARGMLDDVTVIAWGEFGRTPKINKDGGRDHWPQVSCALLAGGGIKAGQVIGATNRLGEYAKERPVSFGDIFATLYHNLGIDPETTTLQDPTGRPQYLAEGTVIRELV
jgi:hypothetical protein